MKFFLMKAHTLISFQIPINDVNWNSRGTPFSSAIRQRQGSARTQQLTEPVPVQRFLQGTDGSVVGMLQKRYWRQMRYRNALQRDPSPSWSYTTLSGLLWQCFEMMSSVPTLLLQGLRPYTQILHMTLKHSQRSSNDGRKFQSVLNSLEALKIRNKFLNYMLSGSEGTMWIS